MFMCNYIYHFKRFFLIGCIVLGYSLQGTGCASDRMKSPADLKGYVIRACHDSAAEEVRWAEYLVRHLARRMKGNVLVEYETDERELFALEVRLDTLLNGDFKLERNRQGMRLTARDGETMLWLQYQIMKRLSMEDSRIEASDLPPAIVDFADGARTFVFEFRGIYSPTILKSDWAGILASHDVEKNWGLWGHQLKRVLGNGVSEEVYATVDGRRYDGQYCFSSEELFGRITRYLEEYGDTEDGLRFMIAPNDDETVCTCDKCIALGNTLQNGTPAVVSFTERLAGRFPDRMFYLLSYASTLEPPAEKLPANVGVVMSTMDLPLSARVEDTKAGRAFF